MNTSVDNAVRQQAKLVERDEMDWAAYAEHYDEMCALNPAYEDNISRLLKRIPQWKLPAKPRVCDLGAGTGNYILRLNEVLPSATFWHVDFDGRMLDLAKRKYDDRGMKNVHIVQSEVHELDFPDESFDLIISVNALYAFSPQERALQRMRDWLTSNGRLFLIDFGREQNTLDWALYVLKEAIKARRVRRYVKTLVQGREVVRQNRRTMKGQKTGRYWLHSTEEFGQCLESAGFGVSELGRCYRDYADLAVCTKS